MPALNKRFFDGKQTVSTVHQEADLSIVMIVTIVIPSMQPAIRYYVHREGGYVSEGYFYLSNAIDHFNALWNDEEYTTHGRK